MRILYDKGDEKYCIVEVTSVWYGNNGGLTTGLCCKTMEDETMIFPDVTEGECEYCTRSLLTDGFYDLTNYEPPAVNR